MILLNFFICITYSVLSCKLATSFSIFSIFMYYEIQVTFQDIEHQLQENILYHFLHYSFYKIFIKLGSIFYPIKIIDWKLLQHCPILKIIYIPILETGRFFIFVIIFHVLAKYSPFYTFFYHNNISVLVKKSNFTLVVFKAVCHASPEAEINFAGSNSYILR